MLLKNCTPVLPALSVARMVTTQLPEVVGVPVITPLAPRLRPGARLPPARLQV